LYQQLLKQSTKGCDSGGDGSDQQSAASTSSKSSTTTITVVGSYPVSGILRVIHKLKI